MLHETMQVGVVVATSWGALIGAMVNYALNRHITFARAGPANFALSRFAVVAVVGLGINSAGMALLEQLVSSVNYLLRQCVISGFVLAYSFSLSKYWTFRDSTARNEM